jgi:hypothetical protein
VASPLTPLYFTEPIPDDFRQGDVYHDVLHLMFSGADVQVVRSWTGKGGRTQTSLHGRDKPTAGGFKWDPKETVTAEGQLTWGIVLTHDCDLQNDDDKSHRLIALMRPFDTLNEDSQAQILAAKNMGRFYLPPWEEVGLPETYVDLRRWTTLREDALPPTHRVASMTDGGRQLLHAALIRYLAEMDRPGLPAPIPESPPNP